MPSGGGPVNHYKAGQPSNNPAGRPKGCLNKITLAVREPLNGDAEAITQAAIAAAKKGDVTAIRLCMDRIDPPRRDRYVSFRLPKIEPRRISYPPCRPLPRPSLIRNSR